MSLAAPLAGDRHVETDRVQALVNQSRQGDAAAFDALVGHYYARTLRLAFRILEDQAAAEDATQEIFLKAWANLPRFRGAARFTTWLHAISVNQCLSMARRRGRERGRSQPMEEGEEWSADSHPEGGADWDLRLALREAILRLPEKLRVALCLRYYGDLSVREIPQGLGAPERTVHHWLAQATARLGAAVADLEVR
ncbi:MAG TPA: RNA polymerase sigma factor [Armatimonadota bacterium]|jgi:RNA polymerase sigma-70 factor (ECF subfamily)